MCYLIKKLKHLVVFLYKFYYSVITIVHYKTPPQIKSNIPRAVIYIL